MGFNAFFIKEARRLISCFRGTLNIDYDWQMKKTKDKVSIFFLHLDLNQSSFIYIL